MTATVVRRIDRAELTDAARQAHLAAIVDGSADAIISATPGGNILSWNRGAERMFGYTAAEMLGRHLSTVVPPQNLDEFSAALETFRAGETLSQREVESVRKDGSVFPALLTVSPLFDEDGNVIGSAGILHDITERRQFQQALAESEADYRATFDEAPVGIAHTSLDGRWLRVNARMRALLGYPDEALAGVSFLSITHPDDAAMSDIGRVRLLRGEVPKFTCEKRYRKADGTYLWGHLTATLHRDASGQPDHFIAIVEDVSERKRAQQELDHLFNLSPDMIAACDFEGRISRVNATWQQVLGYRPDELRGQPFMPMVHHDDRAATSDEMRRLLAGESTIGFTNRYRATDGSYRWIEWHAKADRASGLIYAVARDRTEHRSLQQQLNQSQKMEAMGRLAGGIAHDFNNLLTAILGFAQITRDALAPDDPARADMEEVLNAGRSAAALTGQLLAFSRRQILAPQPLDLNAVVVGIEALLRRVIGEDITLETSLETRCCCINADRTQLDQVMMNLAVNARDAMPSGGTLAISTAVVDADAPQVLLTIADTGTGMDAEVMSHLFEPFYTTKEQGKGTGLGLATVYGIVNQSGGHIEVESAPGKGTSFRIRLPYVASEEGARRAPETTVAPTGRAVETILVVEDQPEVRNIARRMLERLGYHVLDADSGAAALARLEQHGKSIQLLLTDVVMPSMSGPQLADAVTKRDPTVRVLFMSGYTDDAIVRDGVLGHGIDFIRKPFMLDELDARVREILDRPRS